MQVLDVPALRQQSLFDVLKAYSLYRPDEGYCQAQAPIAAVLLMHMPPEVNTHTPVILSCPGLVNIDVCIWSGRKHIFNLLHLFSFRAQGCVLGSGPDLWEVPAGLLQHRAGKHLCSLSTHTGSIIAQLNCSSVGWFHEFVVRKDISRCNVAWNRARIRWPVVTMFVSTWNTRL